MTLGRTIWFFIKLGIVVAAAIWLAERPGLMSVTWLGHRLDVKVGVAVTALFLLLVVFYWLWRIWHFLRRVPGEVALTRANSRQARGYKALTRGMVAAAAGDAVEAKRLAKTAHKLLDAPALTLLLGAQAAQLEGDETTAERYYDALAKDPETAVMGLRGLTLGALKRGDEAAALGFAEKAMAANANAAWAAETAHRLQLKQGNLAAAEQSLKALVRAGGMNAKAGQHRRAVLLTEKARLALAAEAVDPDLAAAQAAVREALKQGGDFVPARLVLAKVLTRQGKVREATKLIEQAWDSTPHPLLAQAFVQAEPSERPQERMKRLERLTRQNPDHPETHRIVGTTALLAGLWGVAREHLEKLVAAERAEGALGRSTCRVMSRLEEDERGDAAAARSWLAEAATAAPDPTWICSSCGTPGEAGPESGNWQAICLSCGTIDSLVWKRPAMAESSLAIAPREIEEGAARRGNPALTSVASEPSATPGAGAAATPSTAGSGAESGPESATAGPLGSSVDAARLIN